MFGLRETSAGKYQGQVGRQAQHERVHASLVVVVFMSPPPIKIIVAFNIKSGNLRKLQQKLQKSRKLARLPLVAVTVSLTVGAEYHRMG